MAESVVSFVLEKLGDAFVKEVLHLYGVSEQVEKMSRELIRMQVFLKDADTKRIADERQKQWVKEVRDLAYDIEDVIDTFLSEAPEKKAGKREAVKRLFVKTKNLPTVHMLGDEINKIEARIQEIEASRVRYGINNLGEGIDVEIGQPVKRIVLPDIDEEGIVGFEADRDEILSKMLDEKDKRRSVISIVGPGGLGKTTLARKVYNSEAVKNQFLIRIWVVISQSFNVIDILRKIATELKIGSPRDLNDNYHLTQLHQSLAEKKYLIILDDIWEKNLWNQIEEVFPDGKNGSRILITTRNVEVALAADPMSVPYKLPFLNEKSSLELFLTKALPNSNTDEIYPDDLYNIGKQFAKKCGGLPLALIVLGGLLSRKLANYCIWSKVMQNMDWGTDEKECIVIIGSSYEDLPFVLKSCFMYFAAFPEDYEIDATSLLRMWIAEGFIPQQENKTLEDTAEMFLEDLVQRTMEADGSFGGEHVSNEKHHDEVQAIEKITDAGYFTWTKMMDTFLLEVLREQQLKGLKNDRSFQPEAYRVAVKALNAKFNMKITREKIVNRLKTLKEIMHLAILVLGKSGLSVSFNDDTQKVQAAPTVWDDLIKENPKLRRIRDKEICNFDLLCDIFGVDRAKGGISTTCKERIRQLEKDTITIDDVDRLQAENVVVLDNIENPSSGAHHENANGVSPSTKSMKKSKLGVKRKFQDVETNTTDSKNPGNQMEEGLNRVTNSMSEIARALQVANENFIKSNARVYSPEEIVAELQKLGINGDDMFDAADLLMSDNKKAGLFFACPDELKGKWLQRNGFSG